MILLTIVYDDYADLLSACFKVDQYVQDLIPDELLGVISMIELIKSELAKVKEEQKRINSVELSDDRAFSYLLLKYI